MFVIKKMRLNKFEPKPVVSNRSLFMSKGDCSAVVTSKDTTECYKEPSILGISKTKLLELAREVAIAAYEHHKGNDVPDIKKSQSDL